MKDKWCFLYLVLMLPMILFVSCSDDDEYNRNKTPIINPTPGVDEPKDSCKYKIQVYIHGWIDIIFCLKIYIIGLRLITQKI